MPDAAEEFTTVPALLQLNNLILKACHQDPKQRFQTANELHKALLAVTDTVQKKGRTSEAREAGESESSKLGAETRSPDEAGMGTGKAVPVHAEHASAGDEQQPKVRWPRVAASLVVALAIAGVLLLILKQPQPQGNVTNPPVGTGLPVVVLMDTTAPDGIYDEENKRIGAANSKEVAIALAAEGMAVTPHPTPLYAGWDGEAAVISLAPRLIVIHRSSFHHSYNAVFNFGRKTNGFATPPEDPKWWFLYNAIGDDKLISMLASIGNEVPRCKFLIYSRGTDTNWLSDNIRAEWVRKFEKRWPKLNGRISTMVIPNGYNGSFRQLETRELLRSNVIEILRLPKRREGEKRN